MADNKLNPGDKTVAESDYEKKFNRKLAAPDSSDLKAKESAGDASWKTTAGTKDKKPAAKATGKKGLFRFGGRHAGKLRQGSAFAFIIAMLGLGVWYTSVFAPNILLVNIKEMYTNDLSDATIALNTYYWKLMNYKIGRPQCSNDKNDKNDIKCKLSTMSAAQKKSFERHGFTVIGSKVDDGQNNKEEDDGADSRYQVMTVIAPTESPGVFATGDMLKFYGDMSSANKYLINSVFNPISSFYHDTQFKYMLKSRYGMTKGFSVGGSTEADVNKSFNNAVKNSSGGIDTFGRPDPEDGISLGSLSSPKTVVQLGAAMIPLATQAYSFGGLQCIWYTFGKAVTNNAKSAKAATVARFALQYLQAADTIKSGTADETVINTLSAKLGQTTTGGSEGKNATDSSMYKHATYGEIPMPSIFGLLYYLDTFDLIAALVPAWSQIMASAAAEGSASHLPGQLLMPPANLTGGDRDYCLEAEKQTNHEAIKDNLADQCITQLDALAPPGWQGALAPAEQIARETCPPPHDHSIHSGEVAGSCHCHGLYVMEPSLKAAAAILSPYVVGLFGLNAMAWANVTSFFFTADTKGEAASDAIFAGTGQILGDMAMSRGMMPGNVASMALYLAQKPEIEKEQAQMARYAASKNQFDLYNKYSFLGSIVHGLSPTYSKDAPLMATIGNSFSLLGSSIKQLNPAAHAIYYLQPDPFNPIRLTCPDPEYLTIFITADTGCNVRYSLSPLELGTQPDMVLDYMTKKHEDEYKDQLDELRERAAQADPELELANVTRMLEEKEDVSQKPFIDEKTGAATPNSEYDKFLQYCVNRQDPWGRSAIHLQIKPLSDDERKKKLGDKDNDLRGVSPYDSGDPYADYRIAGFPSIIEGASKDQDWYTGKKCLEQSEMLTNFRAYTMLCSVDGTLSGALNCSTPDNSRIATYSNDFFSSNNILFIGG